MNRQLFSIPEEPFFHEYYLSHEVELLFKLIVMNAILKTKFGEIKKRLKRELKFFVHQSIARLVYRKGISFILNGSVYLYSPAF